MSKYGEIACLAAKRARSGIPADLAWKKSAAAVYPTQQSSRDKGCPRCAFLGLAEDGIIEGVPRGHYTNSKANRQYALEGIKKLSQNPKLSDDPNELWRQVMAGVEKQHNEQMNVVIALWNAGDITDAT